MRKLLYLFFLIFVLLSCSNDIIKIENNNLIIEINAQLKTRINNKDINVKNLEFIDSEFLIGRNREFVNFEKTDHTVTEGIDSIGTYELNMIYGELINDGYELLKTVSIRTYNNIPDFAIYNVSYENIGKKIIQPTKWINNNGVIQSELTDSTIWSFQGESTGARADWILPVREGFYQKNYMGMNNSDYGGGIPVVDLWRRDGGIAKGHLELVPKLVSLPVKRKMYSNQVESWIEYKITDDSDLKKGDKLKTYETFVMAHKGDCFNPLRNFSEVMQLKGLEFIDSEESAFEPVWCAWGYERDFNLNEILGTLPKVKELGFKWAVLDDGFQQAEGDWNVNKEKFPNGDADMINFVNTIHSYGLKAKLWWAPLAADPGSKLLEQNPDMKLITKDETPQYITWWDSYYLSPSNEQTIAHTKDVIQLFMGKWGFDGLKLDGQHMNAIPPDYNTDKPRQATEQLPQFYKMIYDEAKSIKPNAVVENCPCGDCMSYYNMAYTNQYVSSDPLSSWQIRLKGKVYRALAHNMAYYGDHVELSDGANDFATSFGIGAVLGTKFTWPKDNPNQSESYLLTPEKEIIWKKWIKLYNEKMLSKGNYIGSLYDIGYDKPETHAIEKADTMYYAFYDKNWAGDIELRGLNKDENYYAFDYINKKEIGSFNGNNPIINTKFSGYLLIFVSKKTN